MKQFKIADYHKAFKKLGYSFSWNTAYKIILCNGEGMDDHKYAEIYCRMLEMNPRLTRALRRQITYAASLNPYDPSADLPSRLHVGGE